MKNLLHRFILMILVSSISLFALTIDTDKSDYKIGETVKVTVLEMLGDAKDWIAIYPVNVSND